jgi:hypothetical protein
LCAFNVENVTICCKVAKKALKTKATFSAEHCSLSFARLLMVVCRPTNV